MSFQITVETSYGSQAKINAQHWTTVQDLKASIMESMGTVDSSRMRLFFQGRELKSSHTLHDCNISSGAHVFIAPDSTRDAGSHFIDVFGDCPCPPEFSPIIKDAQQGLTMGLAPRLAMEGIGGTYFLRDGRRRKVAVFKPGDEEPYTPNNPKGYVGTVGQQSMRPGVLSGEGYLREVAAFLLDRARFSGVPMTVVAEMRSSAFNNQNERFGSSSPSYKVGSLQEFVHFDDLAGDLAPQSFPIREVHKIGILDIRMCNTDRNDANILVRRRGRKSASLIPIDHSYSIPDTLEVAWTDWVWYSWPQAKKPFDRETLEYIQAIDIDKDCDLLRRHLGIRDECLRTLRITTILLKKGAAAGLTLYDIASVMLRDDLDLPSKLEVTCAQADALARTAAGQSRTVPTSHSMSAQLSTRVGSIPSHTPRTGDIALPTVKSAGLSSTVTPRGTLFPVASDDTSPAPVMALASPVLSVGPDEVPSSLSSADTPAPPDQLHPRTHSFGGGKDEPASPGWGDKDNDRNNDSGVVYVRSRLKRSNSVEESLSEIKRVQAALSGDSQSLALRKTASFPDDVSPAAPQRKLPSHTVHVALEEIKHSEVPVMDIGSHGLSQPLMHRSFSVAMLQKLKISNKGFSSGSVGRNDTGGAHFFSPRNDRELHTHAHGKLMRGSSDNITVNAQHHTAAPVHEIESVEEYFFYYIDSMLDQLLLRKLLASGQHQTSQTPLLAPMAVRSGGTVTNPFYTPILGPARPTHSASTGTVLPAVHLGAAMLPRSTAKRDDIKTSSPLFGVVPARTASISSSPTSSSANDDLLGGFTFLSPLAPSPSPGLSPAVEPWAGIGSPRSPVDMAASTTGTPSAVSSNSMVSPDHWGGGLVRHTVITRQSSAGSDADAESVPKNPVFQSLAKTSSGGRAQATPSPTHTPTVLSLLSGSQKPDSPPHSPP